MAGHLEFNTPVIGSILVGVIVGPFGPGRRVGQFPSLFYVMITRPEAIAPFAAFGVILLLFEILKAAGLRDRT
jgi:monovalent cation:H+ antiporter-2, CPA2 family